MESDQIRLTKAEGEWVQISSTEWHFKDKNSDIEYPFRWTILTAKQLRAYLVDVPLNRYGRPIYPTTRKKRNEVTLNSLEELKSYYAF